MSRPPKNAVVPTEQPRALHASRPSEVPVTPSPHVQFSESIDALAVAIEDSDLRALKEWLTRPRRVLAAWAEVDRPATFAEVSYEVGEFMDIMPVNSDVDREKLAVTIADDLADARVTRFELTEVPRAARRSGKEFLTADMALKALASAQRRSRKIRATLRTDVAELASMIAENVKRRLAQGDIPSSAEVVAMLRDVAPLGPRSDEDDDEETTA